MMTVWFASGNAHKKKELAQILYNEISSESLGEKTPVSFELRIPSDAGIDFGPEETGNTFLQNSLLKAQTLYSLLNEKGIFQSGNAVIADDSGICVDALGGRPGVQSAYYGWMGNGHKLSAPEQNALLLSELGNNPNRSARFVCAMVLYYSCDRFFVAQETLEGEVAKQPHGQGGFGYDPILYIPSLARTVAELSAEEKNRYSHRGKAAKLMARIIAGGQRQ